jgi:hypothetical protein
MPAPAAAPNRLCQSSKRQHPPREEVRRVSFGWRAPGRRSVPAFPSFTGRRWIPTEFVNLAPRLRGRNGAGRGRRCDRRHLGGGHRGGGRYRPFRRSPGGGGSRRNSSISCPAFAGGTAPAAGGGATGAIWVADTGEEVGIGISVVHREEVDPDGIRQSRAPPSGRAAPVAGGGATGAGFVENIREEVNVRLIRQDLGGGRP